GALSALVVGACMTAPLFAVLAFIAHTGNAVLGGAALFSMGVGLGVPLLIIGLGAGTLLPRAGVWMGGVKVFFGVAPSGARDRCGVDDLGGGIAGRARSRIVRPVAAVGRAGGAWRRGQHVIAVGAAGKSGFRAGPFIGAAGPSGQNGRATGDARFLRRLVRQL